MSVAFARENDPNARSSASRNVKRSAITAAVVAAGLVSASLPASVASAATATAKPIVMSTSWTSTRDGLALSYPKEHTGARPSLFETSNGGTTWRALPTPPVPYPPDNDFPAVTWASGVIAITNGTHIVASDNGGKHWSTVRLAGPAKPKGLFVSDVTIADGRLFALVSTSGTKGTDSVYSGGLRAGAILPVRGLSVSGGTPYGDLTVVGGSVQVSLGADYTTEHYWISRNGTKFSTAPLPCPVSESALLGGVRDGRSIALCSSSPSSVGPGTDTDQVRIAPRLGGQFKSSGPVLTASNQQNFAAATDEDMVIAGSFPLYVTGNAGRTWAQKLVQPNGAFWTDLAFQSGSTGVTVALTVTNSLKEIGTLYRTTNDGRTWHALTLP
jgi:hypothetical protein